MRTFLAILLAIVAITASAVGKRNTQKESDDSSSRLSALQQENQKLQQQVDSLRKELTVLNELRDGITTPIQECLADTTLLKDQDPDRIKAAIANFETSRPVLEIFSFGPSMIADLKPKTEILSARLKDMASIHSALSLLSAKHTEAENTNAIKAMSDMSKRSDLSKADTDYAEWLSVRLEGEWVVRNKMKDMMHHLIKEWQLIPNANEARKVLDRIVYGKLVDGFYPGQKKLPGEYVLLNNTLREIVNALDNFNDNANKLNSVGAFKKWATDIINKL